MKKRKVACTFCRVLGGTPSHHHLNPASQFHGATPDVLLVTVAQDGSVNLHEVALWRYSAVVAGSRQQQQPQQTQQRYDEPVGEDVYSVQLRLAARLQEAQGADNDGKGLASSSSSSSSVLSSLIYLHRQLGWTVLTGDARGRLRFHALNGTLVKVGRWVGGVGRRVL